MAVSKAVLPFLVGMMILTGVCNTLLTKYQDNQCVRNCSDPDRRARHNFEQPVWQTAQMFVGEAGCWLVVLASTLYRRFAARGDASRGGYERVGGPTAAVDGTAEEGDHNDRGDRSGPSTSAARPLRGWRVLLLALPACCDIIATSLMNVGLLFVAASIYQMTRGALVLFVGLFSVVFLGSRLAAYKWAALVVVVAGVAVVGLAGIVENRRDRELPGHTDPPEAVAGALDLLEASLLSAREVFASATPSSFAAEAAGGREKNVALQTLVGILLIFLAQLFTASQFVIEESIMHRYTVTPLSVVGWEGVYGLAVTMLLILVGHFAYGRTDAGRGGYLDARAGWRDMTGNTPVLVSSFLIMLSIGGFNYFGLAVTRGVSATSRSTIDTSRTLFIWIVSLGLGWESFKWLQIVGFGALVYGTFLFNDIVPPPAAWMKGRDGERQRLLPDRPPGLAET